MHVLLCRARAGGTHCQSVMSERVKERTASRVDVRLEGREGVRDLVLETGEEGGGILNDLWINTAHDTDSPAVADDRHHQRHVSRVRPEHQLLHCRSTYAHLQLRIHAEIQ